MNYKCIILLRKEEKWGTDFSPIIQNFHLKLKPLISFGYDKKAQNMFFLCQSGWLVTYRLFLCLS